MVRNGKCISAVTIQGDFFMKKPIFIGNVKEDVYTVYLRGVDEDAFENRVTQEIGKAISSLKKTHDKIYVDVNSFVREGDTASYVYSVISEAVKNESEEAVSLLVRFSTEKTAAEQERVKRQFEAFAKERGTNEEDEEVLPVELIAQKRFLYSQKKVLLQEALSIREEIEKRYERDHGKTNSLKNDLFACMENLEYIEDAIKRLEQTELLYRLKAAPPAFHTGPGKESTDNTPHRTFPGGGRGMMELIRIDSPIIGRKRLEEQIKKSEKLESEIKKFMKENEKPFEMYLSKVIKEKGLTDPEVYKRSGVAKDAFHKIITGKVMPKRRTVAALAIGLRLDEEEANLLYEAAGYKLGWSDECDLIIHFFIQRQEYDIEAVNDMMEDITGHPLTGETRSTIR